MLKTFNEPGIGENFINLVKGISGNFTAKNILNREKLKVIPLRSEVGKGCLPSPFLFNIVLDALAQTIK